MVNYIFSDGMVLAAGKPVRVFGTGDGEVIVRLGGMTASAKSHDGCWIVEFPKAPPAGAVYELVVNENGDEHVFHDVRVGEVWLLAGQSNMEFRLKDDSGYPECVADDDGITYFECRRPDDAGQIGPEKGWHKPNDGTIGKWSAIGWYFARERRRISGRAIGLVGCNKGASTVQTWMPAEIAMEPRYQLPREEMHNDHFADVYFWNKPGDLYGSMFRTIVPFSFTGILWYQGESNTGSGEYKVYPELLSRMIDTWRSDLMDSGLEFRLVTIADFSWRDDDGWRNIQKAIEGIPVLRSGVKVVPCNVVPAERDQIHPPSKTDLAVRLAMANG